MRRFISIFAFVMLITNTCFADEYDELSELESEFESKDSGVYDPLRGYNRFMHGFNMYIYEYVEYPILVRYQGVVPKPVRSGIGNFFHNLTAPVRIIAQLVALEPKKAMHELGYFIINTTWGVGGFIDHSQNHRKAHGVNIHMDIGTGLAHAGVPSGPYIVLPLLGPSNLRDTLSLPLSMLSNPVSYVRPKSTSLGLSVWDKTNEYSQNIKEINMLYKGSLDSYPLVRDFYEQHRKEISK